MTKLCPRGKAAAKRKFKVYPSAYANAYASKICAGKIKDPSGVKRKDFRGPKPVGKRAGGMTAGSMSGMGRLQKARMMKDGGESNREVIEKAKEFRRKSKQRKQRKGFERKYPGPARPGNPVVAYEVKKGGLTSELNNPAKGYTKGGNAKIKKVISGLHKASATHKAQAKSLQTVVGKSVGGMADYYKDLM